MSVNSYRPIAALPTVSKLVERTAQQQIINFLEETQQINNCNHAYRKHLSTTTTLSEILDEIYKNTEDRKMSSLMAIDMSAAFDSVSHPILLAKMRKYGLGENVIKWVEDYLTFRSQYVTIGRAHSRVQPLDRGVPQGSVVGPLLFAIYVNELTEVVKNPACLQQVHQDNCRLFGIQCRVCGSLTAYADDSTYVVGNRSRAQNQIKLRRNLDEIKLYLNDNQLAINLTKTSLTELMIRQKKCKVPGNSPSLTAQEKTGVMKLIEDSNYTRVLGGNLQLNLTWTAHLETGNKALLPSVSKQLGRLRQLGKLLPRKSRASLARGLILSRLNYLMALWGGTLETQIRKIQTIVNTAARWVTGLPKRTRVKTVMTEVRWYSIKEQIKMTTALQMWKIVHLEKPGRLRESLTVEDDLSIDLIRPRLQFTENCFKWRGSSEWNRLPSEIRQEKSISKFKVLMKRHIMDERTRPPVEYIHRPTDHLMIVPLPGSGL